MAFIKLRLVDGKLSFADIDANFSNLNNDKIERVLSVTDNAAPALSVTNLGTQSALETVGKIKQDGKEVSINGILSKDVSGNVDVLLTDQEARHPILDFFGTLTGTVNVRILESAHKTYIVKNSTTGAFNLVFRTNSGVGIIIPQGDSKTVYNDGTNVVVPVIDTVDLKNNSVTTAKILDGNVTDTKLASNSVTTSKILDGNVTPVKLSTGSPTWDTSGNLTVPSKLTVGSFSDIKSVLENATISATAATGTVNLDAIIGSVFFYTVAATNNWTFNFRGNSTTTLNSQMAIGESISIAFLATIGATQYRATAFQIDGITVTPKWQGGTAPTSGNANATDVYTFNIIKTADATFTVLASLTKFA